MRGDTDTPDPADADLVGALLDDLASAFDLGHEVDGRSLGERLGERLRRLRERDTPTWGTSGDPAQVASADSRFLRFLYHPHLYPGMEPKLRLAHELQFDLLPTRLPAAFPLAVSAVLESYCHLSGDLLGWRVAPSGAGLLWMIDVSGHGVRSGLASAVLKILLDHAPPHLGPAHLLAWLHRDFRASRNPADRRPLYATAVVLEVARDGSGRFASAGHHPVLQRTPAGELMELPSTAPPLALLADVEFREVAVSLGAEDVLLLYTDGLVEAESAEGEPFGGARLAALLRDAGPRLTGITRALCDAVVAHDRRRALDDDLTFLAAGRTPAAG